MSQGAGLTARQHAAVAAWWARVPNMERARQEYQAAGFTVAFSCIGWAELRERLPEMAEVLGASIIARHRPRA